jgi:O-antigen ligase
LTVVSRSQAVPILQLFALTLMVIPSDVIISAIGANGYPAALVGMFAFGLFFAVTLLGQHNPLQNRSPVRSVLLFLWLSALISYVLMDRAERTVTEMAAADRMIMLLATISGVIFVASECLNSLRDVRRVLRALTWGGAFCGVIASLQFWLSLDLTPFLRALPGFAQNYDNPGIISRAALNRVAGTSISPLELGVVAGMLLPLAIFLGVWDKERTPRRRWAPVVLIGLSVPTSVSRSAVLSTAVALLVLIVLIPPKQRLIAIAMMPVALGGVFMTAHGLIGTLKSFFVAGTADQSIATRVEDYPLVERLVREAPLFGRGGGTYIPDNMIDILDNQFLKTAIEFGLVGVVALLAYVLVPVFAVLIARAHSRDPELRMLCAALAGSSLAAGVSSVTFDSWSFPMFVNVQALVIGLIGAAWRLAAHAHATATADARIRPRAIAGAVTPTLGPAGG